MLAHMVYFTLKDRSPEKKARLVESCRLHLTGHAGTLFFACGTLCEELTRDVNVRDFDVALHLVFRTQEDHDAYQAAPRHHQFVDENRDNWEKVRVFDSVVQGA
jgi:hypothetical protein